MAFDGEKFGREVVAVVKDYLARRLSPIEARIDALEAQARSDKSRPAVRVKAPSRVQP